MAVATIDSQFGSSSSAAKLNQERARITRATTTTIAQMANMTENHGRRGLPPDGLY
jgi:hypothetical protein